ncbi:MAG: nitroreductase family protein [Desulfopila sp.]
MDGMQPLSNPTLDAIWQRRSVRNFKPDQIADEALAVVLEAAVLAPSAMNQQKWFFTVVQNRLVLEEMNRIVKENKKRSQISYFVRDIEGEGYHSYYHAPTVVVVSAEKGAAFVAIDCGAALQNMALAAQSLGIGSCIMGSGEFLFQSPQGQHLKGVLAIPSGYEHVCTVALGYNCNTCAEPVAPPRNRGVFHYIR